MSKYCVHFFYKEFLLFHGYCSALFGFKLSVRMDWGRSCLAKRGLVWTGGEEG